MEHEIPPHRLEQLEALSRHLWGVDFGKTADPQGRTILVQQEAELSEWPQSVTAPAVVFAEAGSVPPLPDSARLVPICGAIGVDGDELVLDTEIVIETVSYATAEYLNTPAPTYLSFSDAEDIAALRESATQFVADGHIPKSLIRPSSVYEVGGFLGACSCGQGLGSNRLTLHRDGASTSPIGRRFEGPVDVEPAQSPCAVCAPAAEGSDESVAMMIAAAALRLKLYERGSIEVISGAGWWFDPAVGEASDGLRRYPLVVGRTTEQRCVAMNLRDLRVYSLAEDGARALEAMLWLDDESAMSLAGRFGAQPEAFAAACDRVLAAVGCRRGAVAEV